MKTASYYRIGSSDTHKTPLRKNRGRQTYLTAEDEKAVVDWVYAMAAAGFPITRKELLDSVQFSLNRAGKTSNFVNNRPSVPWVQKFVKRHNIPLRTPETIDLGKALLNPEDLEKWADRVMQYLKLVKRFNVCTVASVCQHNMVRMVIFFTQPFSFTKFIF